MVTAGPPVLNLRLNSRPDSAGLVRAVLGGLAIPLALRPELVNDVKTAISEACNNAVEHAYHGESGAIAVHLDVGPESLEASVRDWGGAFQHLASAGDRMRVGLSVISALADRTEFLTAPGRGTEVRMGFDIRHDRRRDGLLGRIAEREDLEEWALWQPGLTGDVVVTLLSRQLLPCVLEPLSDALAARARFSLERFRDVYLVTRAVAMHVGLAASGSRVSFALSAGDQRLDLMIGPLRPGAAERLAAMADSDRPEADIARIADEVMYERVDTAELLRVVVRDSDRIPRAVGPTWPAPDSRRSSRATSED